jgi:Flp pilus assembly protein TadG
MRTALAAMKAVLAPRRTTLAERRGSVALMTALLAVPLIAMVGLAIDVARVTLVKSRLQMSLDAAVLVVARSNVMGGTSADGIALFWSNFGRASGTGTTGYMGATATTPIPTFAPGGASGSVLLTSTATLKLTMLGVLGVKPVTVNGASTAQSAATGLEVALVLDNTGSMAGSSITSLIAASQQLVGILYGGADVQPKLWVSVVPFAAAVNIGNTHTNWLVGGSLVQSKYAPKSWLGCVMARTAATGAQAGDDFNDLPPVAPHLFQPFLYASTWHVYSYTTGSGQNKVTNYYTGDDDWTQSPNNITEPASGDTSKGPNLDCPSLPILPETASKTTVLATINKMIPIYRGGTFINLGLQAGWWTLSPAWRGVWGDPAMPLAYKTPYMQKAIVLMTDGNNNWNDWNGGAPGQGASPWADDGDADYTAYGRLKGNTRGLSISDPTTQLNTWMSQMCTTIKANGIIIYTVLFNNNNAATATLFRDCASPGNYYNSPTGTDLQNAFKQIGTQLSNLRIAQ